MTLRWKPNNQGNCFSISLNFYNMKKCSILLILFLFSNCKVIQMITDEEFSEVSNEMQLEIIGNKLFTNVTVRDSSYKFRFDTGATKTVLSDTTLIENFHEIDKVRLGRTQLVNKTASLDKVAFASKNEMYLSNNEITIILVPEAHLCKKPDLGKGILGMGYFTISNEKKILNLDFESSKAKVLSESDKQLLLKDYEEIKSKFTLSGKNVNIFLKINDVEELFLFDTGNSAAPLVIGSQSKLKLKDGIKYHGSIITGADNSKSDDINIYYNNVNIKVNNTDAPSLILYNSAYFGKRNNVGLSFIKNFNWIIDYKNQKVYYKQIKEDFPKEFKKTFKYLANNNNGNLYVSIKLSSASAYNIGDQITSVNDILITATNLCEMQSLLNKTNDWTTLKLEVIPVQQN